MKMQIRASTKIQTLQIKQKRALYAFLFEAIKRGSDAGNILAQNVLRMPNNKGLIFNFT
jgi:hypothetical protein